VSTLSTNQLLSYKFGTRII